MTLIHDKMNEKKKKNVITLVPNLYELIYSAEHKRSSLAHH